MDVRQSSFSELLAANSLRTAFTSTVGWGDLVAGDAAGAAVVGTDPIDAVTPAVVGGESVEAVRGGTDAGLAADEAVVCPKILDMRLENIPIRTDLVKDRYCQDFAAAPDLGRWPLRSFAAAIASTPMTTGLPIAFTNQGFSWTVFCSNSGRSVRA